MALLRKSMMRSMTTCKSHLETGNKLMNHTEETKYPAGSCHFNCSSKQLEEDYLAKVMINWTDDKRVIPFQLLGGIALVPRQPRSRTSGDCQRDSSFTSKLDTFVSFPIHNIMQICEENECFFAAQCI
ncbi:hypothetical protein Nepgr_011445 [Nepenthes gracilis]|uniref:Uncharacterized protein n=1 Tax=Nepenthes gracilis TaxID=150966 RepID=A0AAD3SFC5_NEPGR|nr:hypothetical protein Nepgr_011445 [Nepenthes gracilis]